MEEGKKKEVLTLAQLATYDDLITDTLVDHVYYWDQIRKIKARYFPSRGIKEQEVTDVLRQHVIYNKDSPVAVQHLLKLSGVARMYDKLSKKQEKEHFRSHIKKYVDIYMPDCAFEVTTTNRYVIDKREAAIVARKPIKHGDNIKYLVGIQVPMTKEEEQTLGISRSDFSVVISRKKQAMLFLGPARFANHDCSPNAKLSSTSHNGMMIVARRDIDIDEEITVSYGDDYFGEANIECLCGTCEKLHRNGWDSHDSKKRKSRGDGEVLESVEKTDFVAQPLNKKPKVRAIEIKSTPEQAPRRKLTSVKKSTKQGGNGQDPKETSDQPIPDFRGLDSRAFSEMVANFIAASSSPVEVLEQLQKVLLRRFPPDETSLVAHKSALEEADQKPSVDEKPSFEGSPDLAKPPLANYIQNMKALDMVREQLSQREARGSATPASEKAPRDAKPVDVYSIPVGETTHETFVKTQEASPATKPDILLTDAMDHEGDRTQEQPGSEDDAQSSSDGSEEETRERHPGDWKLTPLALGTPFARWVNCRVCGSDFVQKEALQTRWACQRCERHMKLYGFQWPKTERQGKHDDEPRHTDWRTVHPFLYPDEEKEVRKSKNKSLDQLRQEKEQESMSQERGGADTDDSRVRTRLGRVRPRSDFMSRDEEDELEREASPTKRARIERRRERQNAILEWNQEILSNSKPAAKAKAEKAEKEKKRLAAAREEGKKDDSSSAKYGGVWRKRRVSGTTTAQKPVESKGAALVPIKKRGQKRPSAAEIAASTSRVNAAVAKWADNSETTDVFEIEDSEGEDSPNQRRKSLKSRPPLTRPNNLTVTKGAGNDQSTSPMPKKRGRPPKKRPVPPVRREKSPVADPEPVAVADPIPEPVETAAFAADVQMEVDSIPKIIEPSDDEVRRVHPIIYDDVREEVRDYPSFDGFFGSHLHSRTDSARSPSEPSMVQLDFGDNEVETTASGKESQSDVLSPSGLLFGQDQSVDATNLGFEVFGHHEASKRSTISSLLRNDEPSPEETLHVKRFAMQRDISAILNADNDSFRSSESSLRALDSPDADDPILPEKRTPKKTHKAQDLNFLDRL